MVRLAHVFFITQSLYLVFDFHVSNAFVTSAPTFPSPFNCMMNLRNERNHILERTFPSFKPNVLFKSLPVVLISSSYFLGYFYIYMCHSEVRFPYNKLNNFSKEKTTSALTPSSMTPLLLALLLFGLLSVEFPENYLPLIFIFSNPEYGFMLSLAFKFILALKFRKTIIQLLFTILSIYIFH